MALRFAHYGYNNKENSIPGPLWAPTNVATSDYVEHFSNVLLLHFLLEQDLYKSNESVFYKLRLLPVRNLDAVKGKSISEQMRNSKYNCRNGN